MKKLWKELQYHLIKTLGPLIGVVYIYVVGKTSKTVFIGQERHDALKLQYPHLIYVTWHEQILSHAWVMRRRGITILVSQSRDGEYAARLLHLLGFRTARGSSTRGGARGLLELARILEHTGDIGIIADGPRGPVHECKPGAILLAKQSGIPIVPMVASISRGKRVNSWDRTIIPFPFATITYTFGDPIFVPQELEKDDITIYQQQVKQALDTLSGY